MRKKDETKEPRILDATAEIILKEGAAAVSTVKVAKHVGISQSNVYLYFKDKDDLIMSVYRRELNKIDATGDLELATDQSIPVAKRVRGYIKAVYDFALANPDSLTLIQQIKFLLGQHDTNPFEDYPEHENVVISVLQEAIDAGVIKPVPVSLLMSMVFSIIHTHTLNLQKKRYATNDYDFETFYSLIWGGMKQE